MAFATFRISHYIIIHGHRPRISKSRVLATNRRCGHPALGWQNGSGQLQLITHQYLHVPEAHAHRPMWTPCDTTAPLLRHDWLHFAFFEDPSAVPAPRCPRSGLSHSTRPELNCPDQGPQTRESSDISTASDIQPALQTFSGTADPSSGPHLLLTQTVATRSAS